MLIFAQMKYVHLFFDLDHTLWDFDANAKITLSDLYEHFKLHRLGVDDFEQFYRSYLKHNEVLWEKYRAGKIKVDELRWKRMALSLLDFQIWDEPLAHEMGQKFLDLLPTRNQLFPYTHELLGNLKEKQYKLHIITNGFDHTQRCKLKNSALEKYFTEVITSECSNSLKPKREIFEYALRSAGADTHNSIMIGDSIDADIMGAMNAGMDNVLVNHTNITTAVKPTFEVKNLKELEQLFISANN
jgi:putative hydrolase of the HAD superfamily